MKLDVVYDSAIIRSTIKEFITKQVTDAFIDQELLNSSAVIANIDGVSSIKKEEIKSVIYSINELALDLANIDFSTLASSITSINGPAVTEGFDKKIDVLYSSAILRYAIAKKLDDALGDNTELIDSRIVESDYVKTTEPFDGKNFKYYSKSEIESLIDSIGIFDISNVETINTEAIKSKLLNITDDKIEHFKEILGDIAIHSSEMERNSDECERDVEGMKMAEYMSNHLGEEFDGMISGIMNFGFFVELDNMIEGLVLAESFDKPYLYDGDLETAKVDKQVFRLGQRIRVRVERASKEDSQIDFVYVGDVNEKENAKTR